MGVQISDKEDNYKFSAFECILERANFFIKVFAAIPHMSAFDILWLHHKDLILFICKIFLTQLREKNLEIDLIYLYETLNSNSNHEWKTSSSHHNYQRPQTYLSVQIYIISLLQRKTVHLHIQKKFCF